jgi:hypothetical protein
VAEVTERDEAREAIRSALLAWRADGVADPTMPVYADVDGDGVPDVYGLGPDDSLVLRPGVAVTETVAESLGGGVETDMVEVRSGG